MSSEIIACQNCGKRMRIQDDLARIQVTCPKCKATWRHDSTSAPSEIERSSQSPGIVKRAVLVVDSPSTNWSHEAYLKLLTPIMGLSFTRDFADDCRILWVQADPRNWTLAELTQCALDHWTDLRHDPRIIFQSYLCMQSRFSALTTVLLVREGAPPKAEKTEFRYGRGAFPCIIQVSMLIHLTGRDHQVQKQDFDRFFGSLNVPVAPFEREDDFVESYSDDTIVIGPKYVEFYDADDLHRIMGSIQRWANDNGRLSDMSTPSLCRNCNHYVLNNVQCFVCNTPLRQ